MFVQEKTLQRINHGLSVGYTKRGEKMDELLKYLKKNGIKRKEFGDQLGLSGSRMTQILKHGMLPTLTTALEIERITNGEVPVQVWRRK